MWLFCVALVTACWLGPPLPPAVIAPALVAALTGLVVPGRGWRWFLLLVAGYLYGAAALDRGLAQRLPPAQSGTVMMVQGTVVGLPEHSRLSDDDRGRRCRRHFRLRPDDRPRLPVDGLIELSLYRDCADIRPGDHLRARARLYTPRARVNEAGFDRARHALAEGVGAQGYVRELLAHRTGEGGMDGVRWRLSERVGERLAAYPRAARLLPALVTGDRRGLETEDWNLLRRTGTAHLLAISGLHITLVAGLLWWLFRWVPAVLWRRWSSLSAQQFAVLPALAGALGYAALAGFSLPTQRALVMTVLVLLALLLRYRLPRGRLLGLALLAVLLWRPLSCLATGFWLSFGAVALLVAVTGRGPLALARAQLLLSLGLGAVTGWLFGGWGLVAPLANLAMIPLFSLLVVPLALTGALIAPAEGLLVAAAWLLEAALEGLEWLADLAPLLPVPPGLLAALLAGLALLVWLAPGLTLPRWCAPFLLLPWLWPPAPSLQAGDFHATVFDVGQGQAVAVRTREHLVLYDLGPSWPGGDTGRALLAPWVEKKRLPVALAFASHGDDDHAGGLAGMRHLLPASALYSGEPERLPGARGCRRGQSWQLDGVEVNVLWPAPGVSIQRSNNRSCVVRISGRHGSLLLTGDIEKPVEYWLARRGGIASDILQVPHHGSHSSSSYTFLHAVEPEQAFASAGYLNAFGHPAERVRRRYREQGIALYNNADTGMIVFRRDGQHNAAPVLWRERSRRPWRARPADDFMVE